MIGNAFYRLLLGTLAVWRTTHLLQAEDGPWDIFVRLRQKMGVGFWGILGGCFYCLSLWIAAPFAYLLGRGWMERLLLWPALSAGAILLERLTSRESDILPAQYAEDKEVQGGLLRQPEGPDADPGSSTSEP